PSYALGFRLAITGEQATDPQQAYIYLNLLCDKSWFYDGGPASGPICPQEAISSWAAIQEFENGTMIWLESLARYYILTPGRLAATPLNQDGQYIQINTPLNVTSDSSGDYEPPEGYFAPDSGFGIVWRGDIAESSSLIEQLGWATFPEFGYQTTFQCSDSPTNQLGSVCYLKGPQGELL
ncbi:MAG: hypothetical protein ACK2T3_07645, partial [Candidatus Promineifilaceae bacterium]